ncbi:cysteine synthase A [Hoylesella nanceiensis]|uniref:cysteine synthase A n=1 Tax=Hoylesella nanceiensis TaxID=425941 RepID=UPI001CB5D8F7|nr:cysteine synthase A [Hoylesella nanceiensis]MBF1440474.1 cysteine synthase A [Hoylesella nanceiensis]
MERIMKSAIELIGNTPLVELGQLEKDIDAKARVVAKIEAFNPGGSVKDRVALAMIEQAERDGLLHEGSVIVEPTSGNTGIGLALVSALKGYRLILTMPETMSIERRRLVAAYGAEVVLTPGSEGMKGAIAKAKLIQSELKDAVILGQFENKANPNKHYATTAEEIWKDTDGHVDVFVAGVGTGGTVSGVGKKLKEYNPNIKVIAVEPIASPMLSQGKAGAHKIQGIGAGFVPDNYNAAVVDEVITVADDEAIATARLLASKEGLLVGVSSGAAAFVALQLAKRDDLKGKTIAVLLPDTGERYLSTVLYAYDEHPTDVKL